MYQPTDEDRENARGYIRSKGGDPTDTAAVETIARIHGEDEAMRAAWLASTTPEPKSIAAQLVRVDDSRRYLEGDTIDPRCTGYIDTTGHLAHDGPTCPIHESGDNDPGDELAELQKTPAGTVELMDGSELAVNLGDPIVFDPTGRNLVRCAIVGIVIDCDAETQEPGELPAPIVRVNDTADHDSAEIIVVRKAFAVLTDRESTSC